MEEENRSNPSTEDFYYHQPHLDTFLNDGEVDTTESTPSNTSPTTPAIPTETTLSSELIAKSTDASDYTDEFECTCAWWTAQAGTATWTKPEDGSGSVTPSPSELLYDELVHRDYVCRDSEGPSSANSRVTPDPLEEQTNMVPFKIKWSLGFTIRTILVNLSRGDRKEFYVATAHKGIMFNYSTNEMRYIHGHIKPVKAVATDHTGQWLVTAGRGNCSKIIVTDTIKCKQLLILDNEPDDLGSLFLGMAPDARMFYSIHCINHPVIKVWKWTYGNDKADFVLEVSKTNIGHPCRIYFHPNDQNFIMVAFEKLLLLAHWNELESVLENVFTISTYKQLGTVSDCTLAVNRHEVYASTVSGCIAIFGNVLYSESFKEHALNTNKIFVKKIKVSKSGIKTMKCCENIIAVLEANGTLKFFDTNILLLYWIETELPPVQMFSFSLSPLVVPKIVIRLSPSKSPLINTDDIEEDDRSLDYETLVKKKVPSSASLRQRPFIVRDFIAACLDGRVFHVDIVHDIFEPFFTVADSPVASLCVSTTKSIIFVAYIHGRVTAFDYESLQKVTTSTTLVRKRKRKLLVTDDEEVAVGNSCIVISHLDIHLVLSRTNGELIFLSPTLLPLPGQRYKYTESNIERMAFSENNQYLAYCDAGLTMNVLRYEETNWRMYMKFRAHTDPITDLLFIHFENPQLFTISKDQHIVEYSLDENDIAYPLKRRVKIEETAIPLCFLYNTFDDGTKYFVIANNEFKFKLMMESTLKSRSTTIGPHRGCFETPVNRIFILPNSNGKYLIFQNNTHMGILKTPLDGNPYKHIGILANPELEAIGICNEGKYVFTYAKGEGGILVWNINTTCLDILHYMGGADLEPYYSLIEGGSTGWFFKEIEDLFCYIQILRHDDEYTTKSFSDKVYISDLPNLMRACGYYPSEVEIEELLHEVSNKDIEKTGVPRKSINFIEFVKVFLNHRPANGISMENLERNFKTFIDGKDCVLPSEFGKRMRMYGEAFNEESLTSCMSNLMSNENVQYGEDVLEQMEPITFEYFSSKILGILQESAYTEAQERAIREEAETEQ